MIRTLLIDDEPLAAAMLREMLSHHPEFEVISECRDGFEGLKAIKESQPDLIFLDVQMPKLSGFEMLELLDEKPAVIFCTAFEQYALKAFDVHSVDYLLKPYTRERFNKAIEKFRIQYAAGQTHETATNFSVPEHHSRIVVKVRNDIRFIPFEDILYLEANDDFVNIHTADQMYIKNRTLSHFEKTLPAADFSRVHRSFIVRLDQIKKLELYSKDSYHAKLKNGSTIPVSKTGHQKLKLNFGM